MAAFRVFLVVFLLILLVYTAIVAGKDGLNLFAVFFGDMAAVNWPGQFNLDFFGFLMLSALWVAWRHQYSAGGLALAVVALFGGMVFLAVYLLVQIPKCGADPAKLLLGDNYEAAG